MYFETLKSIYNEYNTHRSEPINFWWKDVIAFEKVISDESFEKYMIEVKEIQSIEENFK